MSKSFGKFELNSNFFLVNGWVNPIVFACKNCLSRFNKAFSKSEDAFNRLKDEIRECFTLQDQEVKKLKNIYEIIN